MALVTKSALMNLDYSLDGEPFVYVAARDDIETLDLDYSLDGEPFVTPHGDDSEEAELASSDGVAVVSGAVAGVTTHGMYGVGGIVVSAGAAATCSVGAVVGGAVAVAVASALACGQDGGGEGATNAEASACASLAIRGAMDGQVPLTASTLLFFIPTSGWGVRAFVRPWAATGRPAEWGCHALVRPWSATGRSR